MKKWLNRLLCDWTHGGGDIKRNAHGQINWQRRKCGRWSDSPVPLEQERRQADAAIEAKLKEKNT